MTYRPDTHVDELPIPTRASAALQAGGVTELRDLLAKSDAELLRDPRLGRMWLAAARAAVMEIETADGRTVGEHVMALVSNGSGAR